MGQTLYAPRVAIVRIADKATERSPSSTKGVSRIKSFKMSSAARASSLVGRSLMLGNSKSVSFSYHNCVSGSYPGDKIEPSDRIVGVLTTPAITGKIQWPNVNKLSMSSDGGITVTHFNLVSVTPVCGSFDLTIFCFFIFAACFEIIYRIFAI